MKNGKTNKAVVKHHRTKYVDHSQKFLDWVNNIGIERTLLGKIAQYLEDRFRIRRMALLFGYCLLISFFVFFEFEFPYRADVGEIASTDIKSPVDLTMVDEVATETKRIEAELAVPPVFDFDPKIYDDIDNRLYGAFGAMRDLVRQIQWPKGVAAKEEKIKQFLINKKSFEDLLGVSIHQRQFEWLTERRFSVVIENVLLRALRKWSNHKITSGRQKEFKNNQNQIVLRTIQDKGGGKAVTSDVNQLVEISDEDYFSLDGIKGVAALTDTEKKRILNLARALIVPNTTINRNETNARKTKARESVLPVQISIKKNQTIVNEGSVIQPVHITILSEIKKRKSSRRVDQIVVVASLLFISLISVFLSFLRRFSNKRILMEQKDFMVMALVALITVAMTKLFLFMTNAAFLTKFGNLIPDTVFLYAAPVAAAPMLVGLLISYGEVIWLFTVFISVLLSVMVDMNFSFFLVSLIGGVAAARGVYNCKKRNDIYWAGIRTGLINALSISLLIFLEYMNQPGLGQQLMWNVPAGFVGGVFAAMVTMMINPLIESAFNYTTDIKLLELSNLNHPVMQEMVVRAPGTYHHSLVVGSMCEAAATMIGANSLLAKVMAYYHDIGKAEHAQYFIENQKPGFNPHDHVSPYMSKTILVAHVKDGAEKGMKYKLGKPIIDGILQHHGTTLIAYFYNKALEEQDDDIDQVHEDDFRYPGPKPQFKEAALVMLADSIEAAARSLDDPTTSRLQNIVQNIIKNKFLDGQLDECDLTLKDLSVIEEAFEHVLLGIYHQRVDYPKGPESRISEPSPALNQLLGRKKGTA